MMPEEKAIELFEKYYKLYPKQDAEFIAIQCALIAVEEILKNYYKKHYIIGKNIDYWNEVIKEIEKL
jgi:hypothetical protein